MPLTAPLSVPVELRLEKGGPRWFRLSRGISENGLLLLRALPEEIAAERRPIDIALHLPEDPSALRFEALPIEVPRARRSDREADDRPAIRGLRFIRPDEESRARIARYVKARIPET